MTRIDELLHEYADTIEEMTNDIKIACALQHNYPSAAWEIGTRINEVIAYCREPHPEPDTIAHFLSRSASGKYRITSIGTLSTPEGDRPIYIGEDEAGDFISYKQQDGRQIFARTFAPPLMPEDEEDPGAE